MQSSKKNTYAPYMLANSILFGPKARGCMGIERGGTTARLLKLYVSHPGELPPEFPAQKMEALIRRFARRARKANLLSPPRRRTTVRRVEHKVAPAQPGTEAPQGVVTFTAVDYSGPGGQEPPINTADSPEVRDGGS